VTVKDPFKLSTLTVSPASQEVFRYQSPSFSVTANYDNGTSKPVTGSISNYNSSVLGTQTVTITYSESGVTKTATANVIVRNLTRVCPICYTGYYLDNNDKDPGCPYCKSTIVSISASPDSIVLNKGKPLNITVEATYRNGSRSIVTGWTSNYDPSQVGIQDVSISYQTFTANIRVEVKNQLKTCSICSQEYELNNDGTDPGCPVCKKTVISIDASPKVLTINKHQTLPITVKATYKDGHTETINDWASNLMADTAGIYEVMILYQNVMDIITVTVMEDGQIECPYCGLKYLFNDSPKGCPSCYVTLTGIEASLRSGGTKVPHKSKLNLQITKIFKDEHRELTYTGWTVSDYNPDRLGIQTITAHYNGFSDQLDIEVVDDLPEVTCPNGHTYYLNADGSDPGCPYCSGTVDKEESLFYFDTTYTRFIIDAIYTNGEFPLKKGDYLKITIRPRNESILSKLLNMFTGFLKREYTFGGEVT
jgi:Zn finger protein HypA/HybF involved in hydrogenase expression